MKKLIASLLLAFVGVQFAGVDSAHALNRAQRKAAKKQAYLSAGKEKNGYINYKSKKKQARLERKLARAESKGRYDRAARLQNKIEAQKQAASMNAPASSTSTNVGVSANH